MSYMFAQMQRRMVVASSASEYGRMWLLNQYGLGLGLGQASKEMLWGYWTAVHTRSRVSSFRVREENDMKCQNVF